MIIPPEKIKIKVLDGDKNEFDFVITRGIMKKICHQKPERSFFIHGKQIPLCSRCLGIYSSYFLGIILLIFFRNYISFKLSFLIPVILIGMIPIFIDGFTQLKGMRESNNYLRLATGIIFGVSMAYFTYYIFSKIIGFIHLISF